MYANYYTCLIEAGGGTCTLDSSLTNYNFIMLKAWAISSLGLILFLLFISWDVSRFWFFLLHSFAALQMRLNLLPRWLCTRACAFNHEFALL